VTDHVLLWHLIPQENGDTQVPHGEEGSLKGRATEKYNIIEYPLKDKTPYNIT